MKRLIIILIVSLSCNFCFSQTTQEIFAQKKTLIKYLIQQVAALEVYIGYAQKGYSIAKDGLKMIGDIKKGDFNLHIDHFKSLKNINPNIQKCARIADIISCNVNMVKQYKSAYKRIQESGQFTDKEISYVYSVFTKVIDDAADIIVQLTTLLTADAYQMKDDERLQHIDVLYADMLDKQAFVQHFSNENYVLSVLRRKEKDEVGISRSLNNLK